MAVHSAWPPLACLAMFVMIVAFLVLKYGDRLCKARTTPIPRDMEDDNASINTASCLYEEKASMQEFIEIPEIAPEPQKLDKYEYAV